MIATAEKPRLGLDSAPASVQVGRRRVGLSRDEEIELAARVADGDRDARNRMVQANLRLVVKIASHFQGRGLDLDDLIGEGNLGLIRAAEDFDPSFGTRFSTYAAYWIKQAIRCALMNTSATIRVPVHMLNLLTKWRRAERALACELRRLPSFEEVASLLGLSKTQKSMVAKAHQARQLRLESHCEGEATNWLSEQVVDRIWSDVTLDAQEERAIVRRRMERLETRERGVLSLRYGLDGEVLSIREIGRRYGVTREWARKLEIRALRKLSDDQSDRADGSRAMSRSQVRRSGTVSAAHGPSQSNHQPGIEDRAIPLSSNRSIRTGGLGRREIGANSSAENEPSPKEEP